MLRAAGWYKARRSMTFTQFKSAKEIAERVMAEARKTDKCGKLTGVTIQPAGHPGDWTIDSRGWTGAGTPADCVNELTEIARRLKEQGIGLQE
jgi:hypothetical protein